MGVGCCVFSETKITNDHYPKFVLGYHVNALKVANSQEGEIIILWEENHQEFEGEAMCILSPNLLTFQLITGGG